jgi:hypothetical protein
MIRIYRTIDELQADLDAWMGAYNATRRPPPFFQQLTDLTTVLPQQPYQRLSAAISC